MAKTKTRKATGRAKTAKVTKRAVVTGSPYAKFVDLPGDVQKRIAATLIGGMRKLG